MFSSRLDNPSSSSDDLFNRDVIDLSVIGGSSVATPVLLDELNRAAVAGRLPKTHVRLYGRDRLRLHRIRDYFELHQPGAVISVSVHYDSESALTDATHVLCQIRPGGMEFRASAERAAIAAGIPGDEGLGPGGLIAFLVGRPVIEDLIDQCLCHAPNAILLQMSSPLGLFVALASGRGHARAYGVCELPSVTAHKVMNHVGSHPGLEQLRCTLAGLNHQSWLFDFRDRDGADRTQEVLRSIDDPTLVGVEPAIIRDYCAVPVPYLKLFLHRDRELARQRGLTRTRGEELTGWANALHRAYCDGPQPDVGRASALLAQRDMGWYRYGVIPALHAFAVRGSGPIPLNLPNDGAIAGVGKDAIVEVLCTVRDGVANAVPTADLPERPARLTRALVDYERVCLDLPRRPTTRQLESALALHPLVPTHAVKAMAEGTRDIVRHAEAALAGIP